MSVTSEKCHACGANLTFNPQKQKWTCNYCGESYTLTDLENYKRNESTSTSANRS